MKHVLFITLFLLMTGGIASYDILRAMEDEMKPWAAPLGGVVEVAHDPAEVASFLSQAPQNWRLIIGINNEDSAEERPSFTGASLTEFFTIIQTSVTMQKDATKQVHRDRGSGRPSILEIAEAVRSHLRGLRFVHAAIDCQYGFSWKSSAWLSSKENDDSPLRFARQHDFVLLHLVEPPADLEPITLT